MHRLNNQINQKKKALAERGEEYRFIANPGLGKMVVLEMGPAMRDYL